MEILYILLVLGVLLGLYLFFGRTKEPAVKQETLPPKDPVSVRKPPAPKPDAGAEEPRPARPVKPPEPGVAIEPRVDEVEADHAGRGKARRSLPPVHDVAALRRGLARSRADEGFFGRLRSIFGKGEIDSAIAESIEEVLLSSDVGVETTRAILARVRETLGNRELGDSAKVWEALRAEAVRILTEGGETGAFKLVDQPTVVLMVGVNGAGKTTTIGKLAAKFKAQNLKCVLAAGDTFRAAAVQQLDVWGERTGSQVVRGKDGADPSSVIFEAITQAKQQGADLVLADTAGRLHTKANLMAEMQKVVKSASKALANAPHELLLVIDATSGQNALAQAREFKEALPLTGIVLTKLDGTAKGGVILGICDALRLPVRFVGLGERPDDLFEFSPDDFVEALLGRDSEADAA